MLKLKLCLYWKLITFSVCCSFEIYQQWQLKILFLVEMYCFYILELFLIKKNYEKFCMFVESSSYCFLNEKFSYNLFKFCFFIFYEIP